MEPGELGLAAAPHRIDQCGIAVVDEVGEGSGLAVLLTHEQQREERREQRGRRREPQPVLVDDRREPVTDRAVPDLVVVLGEHDEPLPGEPGRRSTETVVTKGRVPTGVDVALAERGREIRHRTEVRVVVVALAGEQHVQRVVEVVAPLRVATHPAVGLRGDEARVVRGALRDQPDVTTLLLGVRVDGVDELLHEGIRARIGDGVHGIQPQRVDAEVVDPVERVLDEVVADLVRARAVEVERVAPRRVVPIGEVRTERAEDVAFRSEVVVDDVEHDRESTLMARVDEPAQSVGAAVRGLRRVGEHAVVAPVADAGERCDRHELDRGDPEIPEVVEALDRRVERARVGERADVHFGDHVLGDRVADPLELRPREVRFDQGRVAVHAVGLRA